ncbi:MAG: signal recognition particle-docking protein FtsY [Trueperella sp.]|nr:signal recognition particle-docking protein FtsY [Trueperella sp.]
MAFIAAGAVVARNVANNRGTKELPPVQRPEITAAAESEPVAQAPGDATPDVPASEVVTPEVETPESIPSRMERLRSRLAHSGGVGKALLGVLSRGELSASDWEEFEEILLMADVGLEPTTELLENVRTQVQIKGATTAEELRALVHAELLKLVAPEMDRALHLEPGVAEDGSKLPATVLLVGVNGTGKTTTVGKLARILVAEDKQVLLGAADTFRAAAADQLQTWGQRVGVEVVRSDREGADPASVAFEAVKTGVETGVDVVMVDTAGRLQNKAGLMDELGKIKRVMERQAPLTEVLLVIDATTGQNGMRQAQVFAEVAGITGIVLTKLDGTAKGGIVIAVQRELGVPVKLVGLGEGADDLAPFDPAAFVDSLLA